MARSMPPHLQAGHGHVLRLRLHAALDVRLRAGSSIASGIVPSGCALLTMRDERGCEVWRGFDQGREPWRQRTIFMSCLTCAMDVRWGVMRNSSTSNIMASESVPQSASAAWL